MHEPAPTSTRRALVTGASGGIGLEIGRGLAMAGWEVLLAVRNRERGEAAATSIVQSAPDARVALLDIDLASLASVDRLVSKLLEAGGPIELLVLNAGIVNLGEREPRCTDDGFELTFQSNYLGHAALTLGLLPLLRAGKARVVVQSSLAAARGRFRVEDQPAERRFHPFQAYRRSKIALGMFGLELARRSAAEEWGISVQFCHPGIAPGSGIAPSLRKRLPRWLERRAGRLGNPPTVAAQTALAAADSEASVPRLFAPSGWFGLAGRPRERDPFSTFGDERQGRELWLQTTALLEARASAEGDQHRTS